MNKKVILLVLVVLVGSVEWVSSDSSPDDSEVAEYRGYDNRGGWFFLERRPLLRQGRPVGVRITGLASSAPGAGVD